MFGGNSLKTSIYVQRVKRVISHLRPNVRIGLRKESDVFSLYKQGKSSSRIIFHKEYETARRIKIALADKSEYTRGLLIQVAESRVREEFPELLFCRLDYNSFPKPEKNASRDANILQFFKATLLFPGFLSSYIGKDKAVLNMSRQVLDNIALPQQEVL